MNLATKAALFNALLFPGWGQIYLKSYKRGLSIIIAVVAGTLSILLSVVQTTIAFLKISPFKKNAVTFDTIVKMAIYSIKKLNFSYFILILFLIILIWILSIIDAYMIGKKQQSVSPGLDETDTDTNTSPVSNQR
ncbi:MAG: DUF5683 domain-containing protein [Smithella sp.]